MRWTLACFLLTSLVTVLKCQHFRYDYTYHQEIDGWLKLHPIPATWYDAVEWCYLEGAALASPVNANMQAALSLKAKRLTTECAGIHTGVHSIFSKGYFSSIEGVSLNRMKVHWLAGEPDNTDNNEDCIMYLDGKVGDVNCSDLLPFVCHKKRTNDMNLMPCGTVDREYEFISKTGSCYKYHDIEVSWFEAFKICSAEGGYLAIINSRDEASVLEDFLYRHSPRNLNTTITLIGFYNLRKDGVWRTVHGKTLEEAGYATWSSGNPDNKSPGQYCGRMYYNAELDDIWCDRNAKFLCEKNPNSLQD